MNETSPNSLPRVTYSNINEDFSGVHALLDQVIPRVKADLLGRTWANFIDGKQNTAGSSYSAPCPIDRSISLGTFVAASAEAVDAAVAAARKAKDRWRGFGWRQRAAICRDIANALERRKFEIAAACLLEVGKSRMESLGEIEEAIDIIRFYSAELESNKGFEQERPRANAREETSDVLRPYGVFGVIAPFNFPVALSIGMSICALLAGNTVVFKPSPMAGLTGSLIAECFSGLPAGVFNLICGGNETGQALTMHPDVDGIAFTGSHAVGMRILRTFGVSGPYVRPVLAEMGGKNPTYVTASAHLDTAISGMARSAFGLQGQKCSAGSVVFVDATIREKFVDGLASAASALKIGDPAERDVFMGPLINDAARMRFENAVKSAQQAGATVLGGRVLSGALFDRGYYVEPTIVVDLPDDHDLHREEIFVPFLTVRTFSSLADAIRRGNDVRYGLTAGIYTGEQTELEQFLDSAEAGVLYANRASGATTGAWPGIQTFCGWKGSGTGSKGGLGTWYLPQFMREQSRTIMR
jgi:1-pyrroline-5-carboxylate dehydrogenase